MSKTDLDTSSNLPQAGNPTPPPQAPPAPKRDQPTQWDGNPAIGQGHGTATNAHPFDAPPVPGAKGAGKGTSVDTPSMTVFANNIDTLIAPVLRAKEVLQPVSVAPGTFYHANQIRTKTTGANSDDGELKAGYITALDDLHKGLVDLRDGVRTLAQKYKTIDDANQMKAKDLSDAMEKATNDFNAMMSDNGGTGAALGGSGGGGSSNGGGGSSDSGGGSSDGGGGGKTSSGGSSSGDSKN